MAGYASKNDYRNTVGQGIVYSPSLPVWLSVPVIVIVFIIFWPLAIYLIWKRTNIKKIDFNHGRAVEVVGWFLSIMGLLSIFGMSTNPNDYTASSIYPTTALVVGGIAMIIMGKKTKRLMRRYKRYVDIITNQEMTSIEDIAAAIPIPCDTAEKDLQKLINRGLFTGAYIDSVRREIVLPGNSADAYGRGDVRDRGAVRERQEIAVTCKGCGASNKIEKNSVGVCEFCGSPISSQ